MDALSGVQVPFDWEPHTRVVFGPGTLGRLGDLVRGLGVVRALVVTDEGVRRAGHVDRAVASLRNAGVEVVVYDQVQSNPTTDDVDRAVAVAARERIDGLVGLGGGSSMDCAKGVNFLLTNGGRMEDYRGVGQATRPMLPMVAIPTTAGTGSEAQSFAVIADAKTHKKMACGDKKAACRVAILDPDLTRTMPRSVAATTGMDAISHAVESYVSTRRNGLSQMFARQAWRLLSAGFLRGVADPEDAAARAAMLLGAHLAGAAIENSMLGAAHALANPLTARFGLEHGAAVGVMLPHVVRFNASAVGDLYRDLVADAELIAADAEPTEAAGRLAEWLTEAAEAVGLSTDLKACGVDEQALPELAEDAAQQWTGRFNPRPVDVACLEELYRCAWNSRTV
ncbi:MAG: iron-containing alcohol dehydrogenase [Planctomycetes bacterium]|nr:iron-containing alcohol dehydrogenase [Planctomycetota bacterium]